MLPPVVGVTVCVPDVAIVPLHAPLAVQEAALVEDQERVALEPSVIELGLAEKLTVGSKLMAVESVVETGEVIPPPDTLTWFTCGEVALAATFTLTVIVG